MLAATLPEPALAHVTAASSGSFVQGRLAPPRFDPGPEDYPKTVRASNLPIELRDGVTLYADAYLPADASGKPAPGRFPVVLNTILFNKTNAGLDGTPAGRLEDNASGYNPLFVKHGYVQVIVDARGTGSSEGRWDYFGIEEQRDTLEIARWLVRQPFSNGRFAAYGASCMAIYQTFMAAQHPAGLKALFPIVPMDDLYRDVAYHGGALDAPFLAIWHGLVTTSKLLPPGYALKDPVAAARTLLSRLGPGLLPATILTQPYDGDYYRERSPGRVVGAVDVPTFVVGGWYDLMQRGTPRVYDRLRLAPGRKQLLMGPWYHLTGGQGLGRAGAPPPIDVLALAWFDRWLKGKRNGIERYGPVTVKQLGTDRWETYERYPRRDATAERFYLDRGRSGSALSLNDGTLTKTPPPASGSETMAGNLVNGICTRSTVQWSVSIVPPGQPCETDNRLQDATSLTYTTAPMTSPLHLSGPLSLSLTGSTTARDTTWIATVGDVAPNGRSTQITAGWLIQSRRALDRARTTFASNGDPIAPYHPFTRESVLPVVPSERTAMAIEIFNTDAVIATDHRLRLTISSGDVPHLLVPAQSLLASVGGLSTVHRGGSSPSFLTASIAPLGAEPAAAARRSARQR